MGRTFDHLHEKADQFCAVFDIEHRAYVALCTFSEAVDLKQCLGPRKRNNNGQRINRTTSNAVIQRGVYAKSFYPFKLHRLEGVPLAYREGLRLNLLRIIGTANAKRTNSPVRSFRSDGLNPRLSAMATN